MERRSFFYIGIIVRILIRNIEISKVIIITLGKGTDRIISYV